MSKGIVVVLSGASSVGKGAIRELLLKDPDLKLFYSISETTRPPKEGEKDGKDLILRVTDNGQGMPAERLQEIQEAIRTGERAGFGLSAVAERLRLYYGDGYGMKIKSEEGKGTIVEVRLGEKIILPS